MTPRHELGRSARRTATQGIVRAVVLSAFVTLLGGAGCGWIGPCRSQEPIFIAHLAPGAAGARLLPTHPRRRGPGPLLYLGSFTSPAPTTVDDKIDPVLANWLTTGDQTRAEELLVTFRDTVAAPLFETLAIPVIVAHGSTSTTALINTIIARRAPDYVRLEDSLALNHGTTSISTDRPWIVREKDVVLRLDRVRALAAWDQVEYIEPRFSGETPPLPPCETVPVGAGDGTACDDPIEGRGLVGSDPYLDANLDGARLGILDTGVWDSHDSFSNPNRLGDMGSFANDTHRWQEGPIAGDDVDPQGHGTATASLLTGSGGTAGDRFSGYTHALVDEYRVYRPSGDDPTIDRQACVHGIERAMANQDKVILVQTQPIAGPSSVISQAADKAVANGFLVVAPTGNDMPSDSELQQPIPNLVGAPATGRGVLSVGAYQVATTPTGTNPFWSGSRYEARDSYPPKPDLIAPTGLETAARKDVHGNVDTGALRNFNGTSGSGPSAAAAASLMWHSLAAQGAQIEPGCVMAGLIACAMPAAVDDAVPVRKRGVGRATLPQQGYTWFGYVDLTRTGSSNSRDLDLPLLTGPVGALAGTLPGGVGPPPTDVVVTLWWPEGLAADPTTSSRVAHNVVTLELRDPTGARFTGADGRSVWQRVEAPVSASVPGDWTMHIAGEHIVPNSQRVYWFVWAHP